MRTHLRDEEDIEHPLARRGALGEQARHLLEGPPVEGEDRQRQAERGERGPGLGGPEGSLDPPGVGQDGERFDQELGHEGGRYVSPEGTLDEGSAGLVLRGVLVQRVHEDVGVEEDHRPRRS
jgi:hypothetical protein